MNVVDSSGIDITAIVLSVVDAVVDDKLELFVIPVVCSIVVSGQVKNLKSPTQKLKT